MCLVVARAATIVYCSTSTSQVGLDLAFALPLRDAQRCHLRLFNLH